MSVFRHFIEDIVLTWYNKNEDAGKMKVTEVHTVKNEFFTGLICAHAQISRWRKNGGLV